jgi:hypothetical protein
VPYDDQWYLVVDSYDPAAGIRAEVTQIFD